MLDEKSCLESFVRLYIHADYFKLDQLQEAIIERMKLLFSQVVDEWSTFSTNEEDDWGDPAQSKTWASEAENRAKILADLSRAITLAYSVSTVRTLHETLIVFLLFARYHVDAAALTTLMMDIPDLGADLTTTLIQMTFERRFSVQTSVTVRSPLYATCAGCLTTLLREEDFVLNPMDDTIVWCAQCSASEMGVVLEEASQRMGFKPLTSAHRPT